jgi:hypothetical protein
VIDYRWIDQQVGDSDGPYGEAHRRQKDLLGHLARRIQRATQERSHSVELLDLEARYVSGDIGQCNACGALDTGWTVGRPVVAAHFEVRRHGQVIDTVTHPHLGAFVVYQRVGRTWNGGPPRGSGYWTDEAWLADLAERERSS